MRVALLAVGQRMPGWITEGFTEYTKRLRGRMSLSDPANRRRLTAALVRQGFSFAEIARALRKHGREG